MNLWFQKSFSGYLTAPTYLLNLMKYPKTDINTSIFIDKIHNTLREYPNCKHKGSKNNEKVGCAAVFYDITAKNVFVLKLLFSVLKL